VLPDLLLAYGLDDRVTALFNTLDVQAILGRVVRVERTNCLVATTGAVMRARPQDRAGPLPAAGDWVAAVRQPGSDLEILEVLPRHSELARRAPEDRDGSGVQVLAANIDLLALTVSLDRRSSLNRLERMLVLAWESGARPIVVLTKADLSSESWIDEIAAEVEQVALGVEVIVTSSATGIGILALRALAATGTVAFIGPSGAGKSSLVNALVGENVQDTGAVRSADHRGRHTTTSRDLIPLPGGGVLIDTPGLRSLGLLDPEAGMASTFADIEDLAKLCQFNDCAHGREPGCAVLASVRAGELSDRRLESYRKLERELVYERSRTGDRGAVAARREWLAAHRRLLQAAGPTRMDARRQKKR
jgi:ribosome biogenesis GTPase / thiamine phosphate phosphatase